MKTFPKDIQFRKSWRSYQKRLLSDLKGHLDDNHLHVIAAPGSGKTVLGLEVARRLNQPTLILAPTVAIRDQWVDRLLGMFSESNTASPDWISKDLRDPRFLTVSTYQGLHSVYTGKDEAESKERKETKARSNRARDGLIKKLLDLGVRTLVLDEAHHLRNEWWRCLVDLKKHLGKPTVVALTATPPFDVSPLEWDHYIDLCGPVDAEITVPELVREKNLCPHQDFVYMSTPLQGEQKEIGEFRKKVKEFARTIRTDQTFITALEGHRCVSHPEQHLDEIVVDPGYYTSIAFFLHDLGRKPSRKLLRVLGHKPNQIPKFDLQWLETLLTGSLYTHAKSFEGQKEVLERTGRDLKRIGAIERRTVNLRNTAQTVKLLTRSVSKLGSIEEIIRIERAALGDELRMVVLTDYIRREDIPTGADDLKDLKRLGVVPIFEQIRRSEIDGIHLGILTGTLTVIPTESCELLREIAPYVQVDPDRIAFKPLAHDERFCEVTLAGEDKQKMVALITELFRRGGVTILVGTASLLGEGWDAPSVNTLVLASFVGSYMLSNQMRGRAIRAMENHPLKTANIWHLVCQEDRAAESSQDIETLMRRFKAFVGVSFKKNGIESGIGRLGIGRPPYDRARIDRINAVMTQHAQDRDGLRRQWELALEPRRAAMQEEVTTSPLVLPRSFVLTKGILAGLWQIACWSLSAIFLWLQSSASFSDKTLYRVLFVAAAVISALAAVVALPRFFKAVGSCLRHRSLAASMRQIGKALLEALVEADAFETQGPRLRVTADRRDYGFVTCSLKGGSTRDRSVFLNALEELLGPVDDPRYILVQKKVLGLRREYAYHGVPKTLAKNKELAEGLRKGWTRLIGPCQCLYTRNPQGHQWLLKARAQSLSSGRRQRTERVRSWK